MAPSPTGTARRPPARPRPAPPRTRGGGGPAQHHGRRPRGWRWPWALAAVAAAGILAVVAWRLAAGLGAGPTVVPATTDEDRALTAANHFLGTYMDPDGRVVRRDQDGSTVSEGQAYGMLLSVAIGDREAFDRAWSWARENLQREDGLLSSLWQDGRVVDPNPAADADLDAAHALVLAGRRFDDHAYTADGLRIAGAILSSETVEVNGQRVLVAGTWARAAPPTIDPSYFDPRAYSLLGAYSGDDRWEEVLASSRTLLNDLLASSPLPPDWASARSTGPVAIPAPSDPSSGIRYGFDAVRVPVRWGASCAPENRSVAARIWSVLGPKQAAGDLAGEYTLDGRPLSPATPAALVGAAGAARASGHTQASDALLDRAQAADAQRPSYYGNAWVALGRVMLTTDWLGPC
jgi:endoglucanase